MCGPWLSKIAKCHEGNDVDESEACCKEQGVAEYCIERCNPDKCEQWFKQVRDCDPNGDKEAAKTCCKEACRTCSVPENCFPHCELDVDQLKNKTEKSTKI